MTLGPNTRVGRVADHENRTIFKCSGSMQVKKTAILIISEGSTILGGPTELHLIFQRCQAGLQSTLCGEASATPFCQCLSCDLYVDTRHSLVFSETSEGSGDEAN